VCRGGAKCVAHATTGSFAYDPLCYEAARAAQGEREQRRRAPRTRRAAQAMLVAVGIAGCGTEFRSGAPAAEGGASASTGSGTPTGTGTVTGAGGTGAATSTGAAGAGGSSTGAGGSSTGAGGSSTGAGGSSTSAGGAGGAEPIDCGLVDCDGAPTPEEMLACCCEGVCCDCDYSTYTPPPECCP
jgi:hypothetical protein